MTNGNNQSKSNGINNHNHNDKSNGSMVIGKTFGRYLYESFNHGNLDELFRPGQQSIENYNLTLAHQRANCALDMYLGENNVQGGIERFADIIDEGPMESLSWAACFVIRAGLTLDKDDIERAHKCLQHTAKMCQKMMKHSFFDNISKWIVAPNYDKYTDVEIFAESYYAQQLALSIALYAFETNSVFTLIKLAYHLRGLVRKHNELWQVKKRRKLWQDEHARLYFEAHMRFANGMINVVISHTPPKFLRIMNFLGYKGTETIGLNEMNRVAFDLNAGYWTKMAQLTLIYYWVYGKPHGENVPDDLSLCKKLIEAELQMFPQSMLYGLAKAKIEQINGEFDRAIEILQGLVRAPNLAIAYKAFYFELIWCYAIKLDWNNCIECADKIRESKHSPVCMAYLNAVFRYVKGVDDKNQQLLDQASEEFERLPSLRIRHFGKTMTTEKAALANAALYFKKGKCLVLPVIAMLYSGNYLMFVRDHDQLAKLMERCEREVKLYEQDIENSHYLDNYLTALFYKCVLLRRQQRFVDARKNLQFILDSRDRIELETSIVPMATLEMGLIEIEQNNHDEAKKWLDHAEKDFAGYTAENFVHLKVYAAIRMMGYKTDKEMANKEKCNKQTYHTMA
uniref:Tetratricopeptide repeat protein 39C-like n=1 Tax=Dermatophagoides pteronyssinus TaxID=6956 RepID=A0A6P6YK53_DERPT|nr:tetratricopeptide repeat protein 39C-like [Dermatophagoides pteronyssinus]